MSKSIYLHFTLFNNNEIFNWIGVGQIFIPKKKKWRGTDILLSYLHIRDMIRINKSRTIPSH